MTNTEFKAAAKKQNVIVYKIRNAKENGNTGIFIDYAYDYGNGTVSTEKTDGDWNTEKSEVFAKFLENRWANK